MDLILWRHAQAQEALPGFDDASRPLTHKGEGQATRVAAWLDRQLPQSARVLVSPAKRAEQTAKALCRKYKLRQELAPDGQVNDLLELIKWSPHADAPHKGAVLLVGHQPTLGQLAAVLLNTTEQVCDIRKGAVWWLRSRWRDESMQVSLVSAVSPELI